MSLRSWTLRCLGVGLAFSVGCGDDLQEQVWDPSATSAAGGNSMTGADAQSQTSCHEDCSESANSSNSETTSTDKGSSTSVESVTDEDSGTDEATSESDATDDEDSSATSTSDEGADDGPMLDESCVDSVFGIDEDRPLHTASVIGTGFEAYEGLTARVILGDQFGHHRLGIGETKIVDGTFQLVIPSAISDSIYEIVTLYMDEDNNDACSVGETLWSTVTSIIDQPIVLELTPTESRIEALRWKRDWEPTTESCVSTGRDMSEPYPCPWP